MAAGERAPWEPQPYATVSIDALLFDNPGGIEPETLGVGPQRHYLIGAVAYDPEAARLYVLELFADDDKPVVHAWQVD